jgi:hypothetical protein
MGEWKAVTYAVDDEIQGEQFLVLGMSYFEQTSNIVVRSARRILVPLERLLRKENPSCA